MILISIHIYKTAGTTFQSILDKIFKSNEIVYANLEGVEKCEEDLKKNRLANKESIKVIHGHFPFGWHNYFSKQAKYISFLREPINRVVSDYFYNREFSEGHNHSFASKMTMEEYLNCDQLLDMDNGQTRYIAGDYSTPFGQCSEEMLSKAKKNIDSMFLFVGLTEKFDESLVFINHYLGWKKIYYTNKNVTQNKPRPSTLTPQQKDIIQLRNKFDVELYQYINTQFEEKKKHISLFTFRLFLFKKYNFLYRKIHPVYKYITSIKKKSY